ncbi:gluconokinase [Ancylobacter radicis]|uniref:Gluconokinase n=1 Tax=Ancylobacter radicis TaxID=2836179 RepID=A0ABS5R827_9HYPH|nr:gluconokinase [Ancylobacter radicis]MBS9477667.1 gluconokinase [Ancylobacter radicis]
MEGEQRLGIVVMGVCGCGKSSVGRSLAESFAADFIEGDTLHTPANIAKMARGEPLDDADRQPWLEDIRRAITDTRAAGRRVVVSCSALRRAYRDQLRAAGPLHFVFLSGTPAVLAERMGRRDDHFMPLALLDSQLATLEDPTGEAGVVTVDIDQPLVDVIARAEAAIRHAQQAELELSDLSARQPRGFPSSA